MSRNHHFLLNLVILGRGLEERLGPAALQGAWAQPFPLQRVNLTDATRAPFGEPFSLPHCLAAFCACNCILPRGASRSPEIIRFSVASGLAGSLFPPLLLPGLPRLPSPRAADKGGSARRRCAAPEPGPGCAGWHRGTGSAGGAEGRGVLAPLLGPGGSGVPRCRISGDHVSGHRQQSCKHRACGAAGAHGQLAAVACLPSVGSSPAALLSLLLPAAELALLSSLLFA